MNTAHSPLCDVRLLLSIPSRRTTRTPSPRPTGGADIPVSATVLQQQSPLASVELVYVTNYGTETPIPMAGGCGRGRGQEAGVKRAVGIDSIGGWLAAHEPSKMPRLY